MLVACGCAPDIAGLDPAAIPEVPSYERDVAPILAEHCTRCHERGGTLDAGVELNTYVGARGARVSSVCTAVGQPVVDAYASFLIPEAGFSGEPACAPWRLLSMPPGAEVKLTLIEQVTLAEWIATGAQP